MLAFAIILVYDTFPKMSISKFPFTYNSVLQGKRLQSAGKDFCPAFGGPLAPSNAMPAGSRRIIPSNNRGPLAPPNDMRERAP